MPHIRTLFNLATNSNTVIQSTTEQKDLGVWTTSTTDFTMHCHKATSKANEALGMIKQNFNICPKNSLMILYKIFVQPHLEYCAPIWNPHYCRDIDILERVQKRDTIQLHSLHCRQQRSNLIEAYKIINNYYHILLND